MNEVPVYPGRHIAFGKLCPSTGVRGFHLTECIHQLILESHPPLQIVKLCLLLLVRASGWRFCGGVHFLKLIDKYIVSDKTGERVRRPPQLNWSPSLEETESRFLLSPVRIRQLEVCD